MNQKDATCNALMAVLADRGVTYELNGVTPIISVLNADDKAKVRDMLFIAFRQGKVDYSKDPKNLQDDKYLKEYVSGLVNNWIRKNPEFNNATTYQAKKPGSRQGSSDESIREMKKLLSVTVNEEARQEIESAIESRQAELKPKTEINYDAIPEALRKTLGL